jgi:hypothetical protein
LGCLLVSIAAPVLFRQGSCVPGALARLVYADVILNKRCQHKSAVSDHLERRGLESNAADGSRLDQGR